MDSRRDFLKKAILLSGVAGFSGVVPESVQKAFAINPDPGTSYLDAEHIVILMQENRSFDHELGTLQGVRGFNDPRPVRLPNGNSVFLQTSASGGQTYAPWRLDIKDTRATWLGSIPHSRESQVDAWNGGNYNNWIDAKRSHHPEYGPVPLTMGHYTREDLPFYYALADAFTVCDQNYCGAMTSTTPNRIVFWTGTVRDHQNTQSKVFMRNPEIDSGDMIWTTYPERLHEAGISWKFYQNDLWSAGDMTEEERKWLGNFGLNVLEFFAAYHVELFPRFASKKMPEVANLQAQIAMLHARLAQEPPDSPDVPGIRRTLAILNKHLAKQKHRLELSKGSLSQLSPAERDLYQRAFVTNDADPDFHTLEDLRFQDSGTTQVMQAPKGDIFYQFRKDVREGKLPTISWLAAPENFSDHPVSPWYGAWYVSEAMDILTSNPEVWKKTIFILTYDENDGYFDHCPSFAAADPKRKETGGASKGIDTGLEYTYVEDELVHDVPRKAARTGPIGLGFRVPMIIASPWTRGGWVDSQVFDHSSTIQFLERFVEGKFKKQVRETNISAWRRTVCGDLTSAFRPYDGRKPGLPFLDRNEFVESIQRARYKEVPSNYKALSAAEIAQFNQRPQPLASQEPGIRQACAIPYELYADGHHDGGSFVLALRAATDTFGSSAAGAPFNVYLYGTKKSTASTAPNLSHPGLVSPTYVVKAGDSLEEKFPLALFTSGKYDIAVHGPNGFYRGFGGNSHDPAIDFSCFYRLAGRSGSSTSKISLQAKNSGSKSYHVSITDHYLGKTSTGTASPGSSGPLFEIDTGKQHGWYDFSITVEGFQNFKARYAGRIEDGQPGYTDPIMGGVWKNT